MIGRSLKRQLENVHIPLQGYGTESSGMVLIVVVVLGVVNGVVGVIRGAFDGIPVKSCSTVHPGVSAQSWCFVMFSF